MNAERRITALAMGLTHPGRSEALRTRPQKVPTVGSTVSVVIPCYNYGRFLADAVGSALSQADVAVDVIVVDDASTDDSLARALAMAETEPRLRVLAHDVNRGPVATFNDGLACARGEFLVRLDADDMLTPGSLARSTALALAIPQVGLVYGRPIHFRGHVPPTRVHQTPTSWTVWRGTDWLRARCRTASNVITSPEVLMRRSVVDRVGGQKALAHTHDMEMWLRIAAHSDVGHIDGAHQAWHREHSASLSTREVGSMLVDLRGRRDAFETLFAGSPGSIPGAQAMHEAAKVALAREALMRACHAYDRGRADDATTQAVLDLVHELVPQPSVLPSYRSLQRRIALGPSHAARRPEYIAAAVWRRVRDVVDHRYWQRWGVYRNG